MAYYQVYPITQSTGPARGDGLGTDAIRAEKVRVKRVYRAARNSDGKRILVDRLWPRGMPRSRARLDGWMKELAPSGALRQWFHAHPEEFATFRQRYLAELRDRGETIETLCAVAEREGVTLLYASKDETHNNATVLRDYLIERLAARRGS